MSNCSDCVTYKKIRIIDAVYSDTTRNIECRRYTFDETLLRITEEHNKYTELINQTANLFANTIQQELMKKFNGLIDTPSLNALDNSTGALLSLLVQLVADKYKEANDAYHDELINIIKLHTDSNN